MTIDFWESRLTVRRSVILITRYKFSQGLPSAPNVIADVTLKSIGANSSSRGRNEGVRLELSMVTAWHRRMAGQLGWKVWESGVASCAGKLGRQKHRLGNKKSKLKK